MLSKAKHLLFSNAEQQILRGFALRMTLVVQSIQPIAPYDGQKCHMEQDGELTVI